LGTEYFEVDNLVKYQVIKTAGKARGVTIASSDMGVLAPLHRCLYDQITRRPWLLRGEAKPSRFRAFVRRDGEVFVSGDYESASDNLRVEVADVIIDVLQSLSKTVPSTVWEAARAFLRCKIQYPDLSVPVESEGQLMGNLLCFPLLCLQNYLAFRWCFPGGDTPVKINGDDIVFRTTLDRYERWADFVTSVGLVLSKGKTLVSRHYFSLNSSFFWAREHSLPRYIPVTRVGSFTAKFESYDALKGSCRSFTRAFSGEAKFRAEKIFLGWHKARIQASGRSARRGLGLPVSEGSLKAVGLWKRECWYFDTVLAPHDVLPDPPSRLKWGCIPPGWKRIAVTSCAITGSVPLIAPGRLECFRELPFAVEEYEVDRRVPANVEKLQETFWKEVAAATWTQQPTRGELQETYMKKVSGSGWEYAWRDWKKPVPAGLRRLFATRRRVSQTAAKEWKPPPRVDQVWFPYEEEAQGSDGVGEASVMEVFEYESGRFGRCEGTVTLFPPPLDYTPGDHFT